VSFLPLASRSFSVFFAAIEASPFFQLVTS